MPTDQLDQELTDQDRVLLVFGYLGPLALVSLVASRREFVKWHARQGLILSALLVAAYGVLRFVYLVLAQNLWAVFAELFAIAIWMSATGIGVAMLVCLVRALEGERFKLPLIGDLADWL